METDRARCSDGRQLVRTLQPGIAMQAGENDTAVVVGG